LKKYLNTILHVKRKKGLQ